MQNSIGSEWPQGRLIVAASVVGTMLVNMYGGTLGVLMPYLSMTFGWTRAQLSASVMIVCTGLLLLGPTAGHAVDRLGPRPVALCGVILYCLALASVGISGPHIGTWYFTWALVAIANPFANNLIWTAAINRAFVRRRGLALSIGLSGVGAATFVAPLLAVWSRSTFGWRGAYFVLGAAGLMIALPIVWLLFRVPSSLPQRSLGAPGLRGQLRAVVSSFLFWRLGVSVTLVSAGIGTLMIHVQPIMRDAGISALTAAAYASAIGPAAVFGRLVGGYLLDKFSPRIIATAAFALPAMPCLILLHYNGSPFSNVCVAISIGLSLGIEGDIVSYITARYLGMTRYAMSYALLFGFYAIGAGFAPVIAGAVFDVSGAYDAMLKLLVGGLMFSAALVASLGPPPVIEAATGGVTLEVH